MHRLISTLLALFVLTAALSSPPAAARKAHKVTAAQAMTAYVSAIRYFNPGIDQPEAQEIVAAIMRETYGTSVDPRLIVAIVATESSFDPTARSSAGARGLGQLMPATAAIDNVTDIENIDQNIHGTVLTLRGNLQHYASYGMQEQYQRAIAAYNAGTGAVDRYGGIPPYDETVNYVYKVIVLWRRLSGMTAN